MNHLRPIFDSHLDLAWSAVSFNRNLTQPLPEIRQSEQGMTDERARGRNTLTLPELQRAGVRTCVGTLLARGGPEPERRTGFKRTDLDYAAPSIAYAAAHGQLAYYRLLEKQGHVRMIRTAGELAAHWGRAVEDANQPLGFILSMEGTDPIVTPGQGAEGWDLGL